tara:strand:- start:416 stop:661 length:246 start_codon:yes stop_codon:yes gene_type:complete
MAIYRVKADANQPEMQRLSDKQVAALKSAKEMIQKKMEVTLSNKEIKLLRTIYGVDDSTELGRLAEMFIVETLNKYHNGKN